MKMQTYSKSKITLVALLVFFFLISMTATIVSAADTDWAQAVSVDSPAVKSNIDGLWKGVDLSATTSPETWATIKTNFQTYAVPLMTESQKALDHSKSNTVSSELESTKTAYENAMWQAYCAGFYANKYVTETAAGNGTKAFEYLQNTDTCVTSYKAYMTEADRLVTIYVQSHA